MYGDIPAAMRELIEPIVAAYGLELVDVERHQGRAPWKVRVIVDTPAGDGRVAIERCAQVSREIGVNFDAHDTIPVAYLLEVSSPGFDRVLAREKDFERALGSELKIETRAPIDGRRRFKGTLTAFAEGSAHLAVDGRDFRIPFAAVARAHKVHHFTPADFSGAA
jgi:ribosome maturation factor RimP